MHDDGQLAEELEYADVVLVGVSRTSKTPTSMPAFHHAGQQLSEIAGFGDCR
jgi:regulator of PEP synthase PpsR (kinase-PPPase family)